MTNQTSPENLLPCWFNERMSSDHWFFGLLAVDGTLILIKQIQNVYISADGCVWIDVLLLSKNDAARMNVQEKILFAPSSRVTASINVRNIITAYELCDT